MTLEEMFDEINARGWRVNNIFQRQDDAWQCNLRTREESDRIEDCTGWCKGATVHEAVAGAMALMPKPKPVEIDVEALLG